MHEEEVRVQSGDIELVGTLCVPENTGKYPVVLMVHGSGALDRNENTKGQQLNIFNTIAHTLAGYGVASFRYDKRGCGNSSGDYMNAGHSDLVQDAISCVDFLVSSKYVSSGDLYILGHSEGCIIAPQVSLQRPFISGLILLCPFLESMESVMRRQAVQIEKEVSAIGGLSGFFYRLLFKLLGGPVVSQQRLIKKVRATDRPVVRKGFTPFPVKWLRELLELDAESVFSSIYTPMILCVCLVSQWSESSLIK